MLFALGFLLHAANPALVDLRIEATSMPQLMPILAKATDKKLEFGRELQDEVLLVSVKGITSDELLERVAYATTASWTKLGDDRLRLTRPKSTDDRQRQEWVQQRVTVVTSAYADYRQNALPRDEAWKTEEASLLLSRMKDADMLGRIADQAHFDLRRSLEGKMPSARLFARLLDLIDVQKIAELMPSEKIVFCTQPTKAQQPLKGSAREVLKKFHAEQATFSALAEKLSQLPFVSSDNFPASALNEEPIEARLVVQNRGLSLYLSLYSASGREISFLQANPTFKRDVAAEIHESIRPYAATPIKLHQDCLLFNTTLRGQPLGPSMPWQPADDKLRSELLMPEKIDPLSYSASAALLQIVDATKANFVGFVPETLVYGNSSVGNLAVAMQMKLGNGWLSSRASDFGDRLNRLPRKVLGEFVREIAKDNVATLDANLLLTRAGDFDWRIADGYQRALGAPESFRMSRIAAELVSALSADQRLEMERGGQMRFGDLGGTAKRRVNDLLLRTGAENLFEDSDDSGPQRSGSTWRGEATQGWAMGVPEDAVLGFKIRREPHFLNINSVPRMSFGVTELGYELALKARGMPPRMNYAEAHRMRLGEKVFYDVRVSHQGLNLLTRLEGIEMKAGSQAAKFSELPDPIRAQIEEMKARVMASLGGG